MPDEADTAAPQRSGGARQQANGPEGGAGYPGAEGASETRAARPFWKVMLLILLAALALRVGYTLAVTQFDSHFYDAAYYELEAYSLQDGRGFVDPFAPILGRDLTETALHPPLTSVTLVPAALLPGDKQLWMRFTMVLFGLGVVVLVGLLGRAVAGDRVGLIAATIAALGPSFWMNDGLIMAETLATLTSVGAVLLAVMMLRRPSLGIAVALGATCALASLARAELALLVPLLAIPAAWFAPRDATRERVERTLATVVVAGIVVAPWVAFNLSRFDKPVFISSGDGIVLLGANCPTSYDEAPGLWFETCLPRKVPAGDESDASAAYRSLARQYVSDHTGRVPVVALARLGRLLQVYGPDTTVSFSELEGRPPWASWLGLAVFWLTVPFAIGGALVLRRRHTKIWPLLMPVWLVLADAVLFYGLPRFRVPAEPSLAVLAAVGVTALLARRGVGSAPAVPEEAVAAPSGA